MFDVKTSKTENDSESKVLYELAILFQYPDQSFARKLEETSLLIGSAAMKRARESLSKFSLSQLEELYTRTFDVAPLAAPYLSAYIYGDENFDRGALLSKLATRFQEVGFDFGQELPDHLTCLLKSASYLEPIEFEELVEFVFTPALKEMYDRLKDCESPYAPLMEVVRQVLATKAMPLSVSRP